MKNRLIGLGIFALVFSFNLLFSGISGNKNSCLESHVQPQESQQHQVQSVFIELSSQDWVLQHKTEVPQVHQIVRLFPVVLGLIFEALNADGLKFSGNLCAADFSSLPSKDLPVNYHNLRI